MSKNRSMSDHEILLLIADRITELNDKLHKLELDRTKTVAEINSVLLKQEQNLADHMKRTELAEEAIQLVRDENKLFKDEVKPILQGMSFFKTLAKVVSFAAGVVAAYFKFKN
jgi:hypothetical protein